MQFFFFFFFFVCTSYGQSYNSMSVNHEALFKFLLTVSISTMGQSVLTNCSVGTWKF
jgi:hypothetical protein